MTQHTVEHQCGTCRYEANGFHSFSKCSPLCTQASYIRAGLAGKLNRRWHLVRRTIALVAIYTCDTGTKPRSC